MTDYTPASEWKSEKGPALKDLKVPSGKTALVRAPGLQAFLAMGFIPNSLMGVIKDMLDKNSGKKKPTAKQEEQMMAEFFSDIMENPDKMQDLIGMVDKVVVYCVEAPKVEPTPMMTTEVEIDGEVVKKLIPDPNARKDDVLYVDEVELEDKFFIMNFACGGTREVEQFRDESAAVVGATKTVRKVPTASKRTTKPGTQPKPKR